MEKIFIYRSACEAGKEKAAGYTKNIAVYIDGDKITIEDSNDQVHEFIVEDRIKRNEKMIKKIFEVIKHKIYYVIDHHDVGHRRIQDVYVYDGEIYENYTIFYTTESMHIINCLNDESFIVYDYNNRNLDVLDNLHDYRMINNYMTISEAAEKWGVNVETVKNKLKPSLVGQEKINEMLNKGLIKCYSKSGTRNEWIISQKAMKEWFKSTTQ